ncbi:UNVERIFIED_CONTAM: protein LOW PSII ACCUMULATION 1, chloroplastic [Sesamum angustifolium]|uniref:Protein LOW PSII ACCUMULATION 1, chloroplastic n=1 Tax=Sesamum angustifolium TaxID=2727405 RepID=A0AAW2QVL7_9LAMI
MAAASFAPPLHHRHRYRHRHYMSGCSLPSSGSVLVSRTWFLSRKPALSSTFWVLIEPTRTTHGQLTHCSPSPYSPSTSPEVSVPTAESCINLGLSLFAKGRVKDALAQFDTALTLDPNPVEAQAALYNKACCHAYREEAKKAADCLRTALREYDLKFGTILNDPDLASFRAMPEFKELQEEARLGGEDIGYSFRRDLKLISEVQAPFRGIRRFFYVALTAAAGISLLFTIPRLLRAIQGGDGAPDLLETSGNAAINIGGIIVLVALFFWDNKKEEEQLAQITRNETLSRLPLRLSTNRIVELVQLRDTARPVILAGNKETVASAMRRAERFRTELLRRGVILEEFDKRAQSIVAQSKIKAEIRFRAEVVSPAEWERWIRDQQKSEGITPGEDVYIILRLDGRVRKSGRADVKIESCINVDIIKKPGMPDWQEIVKEVPPMEAFFSKLER